ncbi:MAG: hypothetical protein ABSB11_00650 [Sedimentisphaerales bacterium]|jgi:hypothetical protein
MFIQTVDTTQNLARKVPKEELYGLAVDTAVLFSDHKGIYERRIEKHQRKLLAKLSFLAPFLEPGERILHVISGYSPVTFVEQLLTGTLLQPLKRSLFAITNRRILHVPTAHNLRHRWSVAQILYADCRYVRLGWATLIVKYKSGKAERFRCISRNGRRKARELLKNMPLKGKSSPTMERVHLCPRCTKPLIMDYYACPNCSLEFKKKSRATILSIAFPGGGYFYVRHPIIGLLEAIIETIAILLLAISTTAYFIGAPSAPHSVIQAIILCAIVMGFEKMVVALFSNRCVEEFIPKQRHVEVLIEQSASRKTKDDSKEPFAAGWRSM